MEYVSLFESLPTQAPFDFTRPNEKKEDSTINKSTNLQGAKLLVTQMKTIERLRLLLVRMITSAKSPPSDFNIPEDIYAISDALDGFSWATFDVGK